MSRIRQEFDEHGIAQTPRAERVSKRVTQKALRAFALDVARLRTENFPMRPRIVGVAGSHANPHKLPRFGLFPSDWTYLQAQTAETWKDYDQPISHPSDADVLLDLVPKGRYSVGHMREDEIMTAIRRSTEQIFQTYRILLQPIIRNDRRSGPVESLHQTLKRLR